MSIRENRFLLGIFFPLFYEIGLIEAYLFFKSNQIELFLFLPIFLLIFPAFLLYVYSPHIMMSITRVSTIYSERLGNSIDEIFSLKEIDLEDEIKTHLRQNIRNELLPELKEMFKRGYIDNYFTRDDSIADERILSFQETLFLLSTAFGVMNFFNFLIIIYLHFYSIDLDFLYIDRIVNPLNIAFFAILFGTFIILSILLFIHSRRNLVLFITRISHNLAKPIDKENFKAKTRQIELDSIRRFPIEDKIGRKLAANWDLLSKLYLQFLESHINEELRTYTREEVARTLVLELYSKMLNKLDLPDKKRKELELQFYLGQGVTAIEEIVSSEEETESIKFDVLYASKKLAKWDEISSDEQIATFLFSWRSIETLFRHLLWKRNAYPHDDQSWPSIVNSLLKEKLLTIQENRTLKQVRQRRNAMLHRAQDRFVSKEDLENLLMILQSVLDRS